jgi:peptidyl-prolyl cis-trans isomerase D
VFDSVTGQFKPELLQQLLRTNGMTMAEFQGELSDSIADQDFGSAARQGFQIPRIYAAVQAELLLETRDITFFVIPEASVPRPAPPTDAQLNALIQQFRDRLMLPERRKLTVVRFSAKALAPTMPVDEAAVRQQFESKKASYGKPELRSLVEIPLNDPKEAPAVQASLSKGADPNAVAKSIGVDAITYADQPQSTIADSKAAAAAFAMQAGQVSGPVQGDFKTVILKVTKITPGEPPDIKTARPQIVADLQQTEAVDKVYDLSQKFEDLRTGGASLADAAAKVGASAITLGPVTADGKDLVSGQPNPALTPKLLKSAFQLPQGGDSDVEQDADKGEYYAVHVDQVIPPSPPGLDEKGVREFLTQAYYQQSVIAALQKKASDATAALKKGQSFEQVAASYGAHVTHQLGLQRISAQQYQGVLGQELLAQIFGAKPQQPFTAGSDPLKGLVIGRVDAVRPGETRQIASVLEAVRQRALDDYLKGLQQAVSDASFKMIKPTTDIQLAHNAMGVDAAMLARVQAKTPSASPRPAK